MSIKIEQKLDNNCFTESKPRIYTTGAYLVPMEINRKGKKRYIWVVDEIYDDTYNEDGICCTAILYSNDIKNMLRP